MNLFRTCCQAVAATVCVVAMATPPASAQAPDAYPTKPVRMIVPFPPGGSLDLLGRVMAEKLAISFGQPVVVENRPGASGAIGAELVAKAPPDGHTILIAANTLVMLPALRKDLPFDPLKDLVPIANLAITPVVLVVHPSLPARNTAEFISVAKGMKEGLSYASSGNASPLHMAGELLARTANIKLVHIPYKGAGPAVTDLLGGRIPAMISPLNSVLPHIKAGKLVAIAVTDAERTPELPNVPTLREGIPGMPAIEPWIGLLTTAGTPQPVVARLNAEVNKILAQPDTRERLAAQTFNVRGGTGEAFGLLMREESERTFRIVNDANIKID